MLQIRHPLDSGRNVNSSIILHTVDDILRQLEIKRENFSLFLTDAARYLSSVGKTLKELYPPLMHVTALRTYYITALCVCVLILKILMNSNDQGSNNQKQRSQERFS